MKIALDVMGGDFAPSETIKGALLAVKELGIEVILVGDKKKIENEFSKSNTEKYNLTIVHADEIIPMKESHPVDAVRKMQNSSIMVAYDLVIQGDADAVVSAGNTGATMVGALFKLRRLKGLDRPAIVTIFPTITNYCLIVDAGANSQCRPHHLLSFALMGDAYARQVMRRDNPRIGLLNVGEEPTKGTELVIEAYKLIKDSNCNFIGNIEAKDIPLGKADVVVTDGFTGNIVLKLAEGLGETLIKMITESMINECGKGATEHLMYPALQSVACKMDYSEYGGALLLGVNGVVVIAHGRSQARAISNAIKTAQKAVEGNIIEVISKCLRTGDSERGDNLEIKRD